MHISKEGGTESGTVDNRPDLRTMLESLTPDQRAELAKLLNPNREG
jgi:hypothetical protein